MSKGNCYPHQNDCHHSRAINGSRSAVNQRSVLLSSAKPRRTLRASFVWGCFTSTASILVKFFFSLTFFYYSFFLNCHVSHLGSALLVITCAARRTLGGLAKAAMFSVDWVRRAREWYRLAEKGWAFGPGRRSWILVCHRNPLAGSASLGLAESSCHGERNRGRCSDGSSALIIVKCQMAILVIPLDPSDGSRVPHFAVRGATAGYS